MARELGGSSSVLEQHLQMNKHPWACCLCVAWQVKTYDKTRTSAERALEAKEWEEAEATFIKGLSVSQNLFLLWPSCPCLDYVQPPSRVLVCRMGHTRSEYVGARQKKLSLRHIFGKL
eukprot:497101-Pelagomonas_calceolata.AAC.2